MSPLGAQKATFAFVAVTPQREQRNREEDELQ